MPKPSRNPRTIAPLEKLRSAFFSVGFIVVAAFVLRMAYFCYVFGVREAALPVLSYGAETGAVAAAIASGRGYSSPLPGVSSGATAWLPPIFPYLLAGVFKLFGIYSYKSSLIIRTLNIGFSALTCWPVYVIGQKAFGKTAGMASAWFWAFLPDGIFYPVAWVWDTALAGLCMALLFAATLKIRGSDRLSWWAGYGALGAFSAMVNPSVISVLPFMGLWALWPLRRHLLLTVKLALVPTAIFILGISPWTARNYFVFHKLIPIRSNFGLELWLGNSPLVPDTYAGFLHPTIDHDEAAKYVRMTEIPYMAEKQNIALAFMRTHPWDTMRFFFRRFADNWLGIWDAPADVWRHLTTVLKLTLAWNCIFSLLSFAGALLTHRTRNEFAQPFTFVMLIFPLAFYATHTSARLRYPIDPIMGLLTVFAIASALSSLARRAAAHPRFVPEPHQP